jgi:hypothetical protein
MPLVNLDKPRDRDIHTIADFIEIYCLMSPDRIASREDLRDYIYDNSEKHLSDEDLEDTFSHLIWRNSAFKNSYPFFFIEHDKVLSAPETLDLEHENYVFLLLCANLPFFSNSDRNLLTQAFEKISLEALAGIWPASGKVKAFGKATTEYVGSKSERLRQLAINIGGQPTITESSFRKNDSGDGGIDLAAWIELDDFEGRHVPSLLAQCACSRSEWVKKQTEISYDRLGPQLAPTHRWIQMIFIPQCFRNNAGKWAYQSEVGSTILMDRVRIIRQINAYRFFGLGVDQLLQRFKTEKLELV